jgi:FHA domain
VALIGITVLWALFVHSAGSVVAGTILLLMLAAAVMGLVVALRYLGINSGHPWVQYLAARPWRDGRDVLQLGLRHLPEVLIITPGGSLLAPNQVELLMNPRDLASLTEMMDIGLVNSSATEVYESHITAHAAALASAGPVGVRVIGDPAVPAGRYRLKQGQPAGPAQPPARAFAFAHAGAGSTNVDRAAPLAGPAAAYAGPAAPLAGPAAPHVELAASHADVAAALTVGAGSETVTALAAVPLLRLVTRGYVAETRISGARAGRGADVELRLPEEPTVSRVHAELTFADGRWHITNTGRNGVTLNGTPLTSKHVIRDGDSIGWGTQPGALISRVEIGWDRALPSHSQR